MEFLAAAPYLARVVASLAAILLFQRLTKSLAAAMALGAAVLALWTGHGAAEAARIARARFWSADTAFLACIILGVIWLSTLMARAGMMKDLVASLKCRLPRRGLLAALPAVVGLLPMPAGALFSAPLLDDACDGAAASPLQKTRINYWFRHIWEYWWPLYPGVLLACGLSGLPVWKLACLMLPLSAAAAAAGWFCFLRPVPDSPPPGAGGARPPPLLPLLFPTLTVVAAYGLILALFPAVAAWNTYAPMAAAVVCGLSALQIQRPQGAAAWRAAVLNPRALGLALVVILARVYGGFIEARLPGGLFLMDHIRAELDAAGIPALLLVVIIPFVSGLTTGITVGYIGASFPVVLSLAPPGPGGLASAVILGYSCGFAGMMLSPIHVCVIVTNEYFKTRLFQSLAGLLRPVFAVVAFAAAYSSAWFVLGR